MSETEFLKFWQKNPHRNLWQHPLWEGFQQALGRKTWVLKTEHSSALVVRHPLPLGLSWLEIPRGPLFERGKLLDKLLGEVVALAKKEKAIFIRMSPLEELKVKNYELRVTHHDHHPETTLVLDLNLSEEELLAQMKQKGRYNIKVAEKNGVTIRQNEGVDAFYDLLKKTTGRDGFSSHPKAYYQKMLQALGSHAQLLVAGKDGKPIAAGIFVYLNPIGTYYYGASDHEYRNLMAPYLLQWEAIKEAKRRGCKTYDFLGIAPENAKNHAWAGVTEFKKKFGGTVVDYPQAKELVVRPCWVWIYRIYKRLRG
ncbi:peptidoglycan bridge formation glycyltransferase FemA/FemB family protein [Candidatus Peregrinibacteria bacterium]|nr:peptidoglycan bridge formation glycyltransferase FemA/FemB family protein [Candidatus Peregrinibacteria bacterium]